MPPCEGLLHSTGVTVLDAALIKRRALGCINSSGAPCCSDNSLPKENSAIDRRYPHFRSRPELALVDW